MGIGADDTALSDMVGDIATDLDEGGEDASIESAPAGEVEAPAAEAEAEEAPAEEVAPAAPAAPVARAPAAPSLSAEEIADLRKHAEIGRKFSPYAKDIESVIARAFQPQAPAAAQAPAAPVPDDYDELFSKPGAGQKWAKEAAAALAAGDPRMLERGYGAIARRALKAELEELKALKKQVAESNPVLDKILRWAVRGNTLFAHNPETAKFIGHADRLHDAGMPWEEAVNEGKRLAELEAKAAGATPAQAKAVGVAVGKGIAANAAANGPKPKPRPGPVSEPTLRSAGGRKAPPGREEALEVKKGGRFADSATDWGMNKAIAAMGRK